MKLFIAGVQSWVAVETIKGRLSSTEYFAAEKTCPAIPPFAKVTMARNQSEPRGGGSIPNQLAPGCA